MKVSSKALVIDVYTGPLSDRSGSLGLTLFFHVSYAAPWRLTSISRALEVSRLEPLKLPLHPPQASGCRPALLQEAASLSGPANPRLSPLETNRLRSQDFSHSQLCKIMEACKVDSASEPRLRAPPRAEASLSGEILSGANLFRKTWCELWACSSLGFC